MYNIHQTYTNFIRYLEIVLFKFLKSDYNWYFAADGVRTNCVYIYIRSRTVKIIHYININNMLFLYELNKSHGFKIVSVAIEPCSAHVTWMADCELLSERLWTVDTEYAR